MPLADGLGELEEITTSYFVKADPELDRHVQERLVAIPPQGPPELPPSAVTAGEPTVVGLRPPEALASAMAEAMPRLRRCYASSNETDRGIVGEVRIRFEFNGFGDVVNEREETSLLEPKLRSCVLGVVLAMRVPPQHPRHPPRIVLPLHFAAVATP